MTAPSESTESIPTKAPHPGTKAMPRWDTGELIDAPVFTWRNILAMIGPGLVMGAAAIGGGEWLAGPGGDRQVRRRAAVGRHDQHPLSGRSTTSRSAATRSTPASRSSRASFALPPHPMFWLVRLSAARLGLGRPVSGRRMPRCRWRRSFCSDCRTTSTTRPTGGCTRLLCTGLYLVLLVPLIFGGKVYNSLKVVMSFKLVVVIGFLLFLGVFFAKPATWVEIVSGLFKVGTVPVVGAKTPTATACSIRAKISTATATWMSTSRCRTTQCDGQPELARSQRRNRLRIRTATALRRQQHRERLRRACSEAASRHRSVADRDDRRPGGDRRQRRPDEHADQQLHPRSGLGHGGQGRARFPASSAVTASRCRTSAACLT